MRAPDSSGAFLVLHSNVHKVHVVHYYAGEVTMSTTISRGIRLKKELDRALTLEAERSGLTRAATTAEILEEGVRLRRVPGIAFADGVTGRRAVIAGTGLEVWEIIDAYQQDELSFEELKEEFPWLNEMQLRSALGYYELYPDEIDSRLEIERSWTAERVAAEMPFAKPRNKMARANH